LSNRSGNIIMAKKQTADTAAPAESAGADKPVGKKRTPKDAAAPADETKAAETVAEQAPATAAAAPSAPKPAADGAPVSKKGRKPGTPPSRGKKLRNQLKNVRQRLAKEGPTSLKRAVGLLKQFKRSKFDETVEVHL
jgi:hypothetical protein